MKLASGAAPVAELLARGVPVAIGTDGPASNNNLDLFEEMRSASLMAKLISRDPEALDAHTVIRMATTDAARVLGMDAKIGSLVPGKLADVIVVDLRKPHLVPVYDPVSHLVYAARGSDVRDVIVNGAVVVDRGCLTTVNVQEIMGRAIAESGEIARTSKEVVPT
jgi:5-methylthioadenosine/S-adenosylhomocysteine deaminase